MIFDLDPINFGDSRLSSFMAQLQKILGAMDQEYNRATEHYQFRCDGCADNCCLTRFFHHTYLEYYYLRRGFEKLDSRKRGEVLSKAEKVCRDTARAVKKKMPVRLMCPLNYASLCILYPFRPMICRLHGIPHELQKPGQKVIHGPGCSTFDERCADKRYFKFDRTPFYVAMAKLENEFKQTMGLDGRIRMTIAEMILRIARR